MWVWPSTKPGATACPSASIVRRAIPGFLPMNVIRPSRIPMSARKPGAPEPSTTIPFSMTRSYSMRPPPGAPKPTDAQSIKLAFVPCKPIPYTNDSPKPPSRPCSAAIPISPSKFPRFCCRARIFPWRPGPLSPATSTPRNRNTGRKPGASWAFDHPRSIWCCPKRISKRLTERRPSAPSTGAWRNTWPTGRWSNIRRDSCSWSVTWVAPRRGGGCWLRSTWNATTSGRVPAN